MVPATGHPLCVTLSAKHNSSPGPGRGLRVKNTPEAQVRRNPSPVGSREPEGLRDTQGGSENQRGRVWGRSPGLEAQRWDFS